ncbi:hypothetical protein C2S53_017503 [Perilla frutescens var. hirtella]|uniref:DUF4378 domain-containing protein n=1 Tax=Perilla frutescens var. hirtella TaxID=608512 RepID=A0AAD4NZN4_PERFH|nr:hypothetical protein C2S53_017503 [Perilla frutescens var. hirtella]
MNDSVEKPASSLAIVEKKPQRPGGCVGIFFQLFDWNRRFAKKKLFSKKLLPPVRFKQASKKFGGDEKQPKLRLIADENNGGFPTVKITNGATAIVDNEQKNEMRVPGLVARLMGLESMPTLQRDKSKKKAPASGIVCGKAEKLVDKKEELIVEKGGTKHEVRPQKLQKTSICERQPITRFGAEKLPFKNVLSKSRKHPTKLPSPVKSPKNLSKKRPSKLIGAATRILEPGLQTSRYKCTLTYSNSSRHPPRDPDMEERIHSSSSHLDDSYGFGSVAAEGDSSCRNCGYLLDNLNGQPTISSQPLVFASPFSNHVRSSCQVSERSKPVNATYYHQLEEELHDDYPAVASPVVGSAQSHVKLASYRRPFCSGHIQQHLAGQQCKLPRGEPLPLSTNQKPDRQNQMLRARETVPPRPNANCLADSKASTAVMNGTKNSVSVNQNLSCNSRSRVPTRIENGRFELEKRINNSMNDSVPSGRKRRPAYICKQGENSGCSSSTINKPIVGSPHSVSGKQLGYTAKCNHECNRLGLLRRQDTTFDSGPGNNNVVSFTFNSSVKRKIGIHEVAKTQVRSGLRCDEGEQEPALGESERKTKFEKPCPISGDALGALLQQKLKELNCQGEDTGNAPKKTTATILQELITALTSEAPFQQDNLCSISDRRSGWSGQSHLSNSKSSTVFQGNAMNVKRSFDQPLDSEHLSPGSVLEPFFSTESCPSSSADDSLGYKMVDESLDCSYCEPESPNPDILDSAASLNAIENTKEMILNNVSEILCCSGLDFGLKGNELDKVKDVLLNAELAFHSAMLSGSAVGRGSPIKHLLLDELDMLASVLWMNFGCSLGIEDGNEVNQLRRFVLDSIMEYLGVRFQEYPERGSKVSRKLPFRMNNSMLILEIVEVVRRWEKISRFGLDELIEREMSHSLGEWTVCETEAFESGIEISRHLFQILLDEILMDLCKWQT